MKWVSHRFDVHFDSLIFGGCQCSSALAAALRVFGLTSLFPQDNFVVASLAGIETEFH